MSNVSPGILAHPEVLSQMRPDLLRAWLRPMRAYLERRGLDLARLSDASVPPPNRSLPDYDQLSRIFLEPTPDMPPALLESLYLVGEMANSSGMDLLLAQAAAQGLSLDPGPEPTPADVALQAWISHRQLLEDAHNSQEINRPRSFKYFSTGADAVPAFSAPTAGQMQALDERLGRFYEAWKRGPGARVFAYQQQQHWCFLVRHGAPCRREGAMDEGRPTTIFYRPQKHDVLVYDPVRGEMGVHCCSERERRVLLRSFGQCLFGNPEFFPGTAKYTLAPLVRRGRDSLACADIPGLEKVRLTQVEFYFRREPWKRVTQQAADIFQLIEREELRWPDNLAELTRATFEIKFRGCRRPRQLTIVPCNKARYGHDGDMALLQTWLQRRQFIDPNEIN